MQNPLVIILGNQLFPIEKHVQSLLPCSIFMAEDFELCTRFKIHQMKIILFLSAMRHYRDELVNQHFKLEYFELSEKNKHLSYEDKLQSVIEKNQPSKLISYEIEDKFFETRMLNFARKSKIEIEFMRSPSFLTSRESFKDYLGDVKKPFMKTFYERERRRQNVLMNGYDPIGGKFSFDEENRRKRPDSVIQPPSPQPQSSVHIENIKKLLPALFPNHPGTSENFWPPVTRKQALTLLDEFIETKIKEFGPYQDAVESENKFSFHSILSSSLNLGLITPDEVLQKVVGAYQKQKLPINSVEGFVRQVMGWREFVRGIYQNFSDRQNQKNFFHHQRLLTRHWYEGTTGIPPLDDAIRFVFHHAYTNHIDRLMILGNLMLLCQIHPHQAHRWFMEMFVDALDWVMGPNVYGMALFSDGGIFATKPYIAASNYMLKMSHYRKGPWCDVVDGLYWKFIETHQDFLVRNPRTSMSVRTLAKIKDDRKAKIFNAADRFLSEKTAL